MLSRGWLHEETNILELSSKFLLDSLSLRIITNTENNKMQITENRERNKKDQSYEEFEECVKSNGIIIFYLLIES